MMKKPIPILEKRLLRFYSKPLLILFAFFMTANFVHSQTGLIVEDCTCLSNNSCSNDGQFSTLIRINNGGAGPWHIAQDSIRGLYKDPSPAPPAQPDEFVSGPGGELLNSIGGGVFELRGIHIDGQGYWVKLTDGSADTLEFEISAGHCVYPHTNIEGDDFVCEGQESTYTTQNNPGSSYSWSLDHGGVFTSTTNTNSVTVLWNDDSDGSIHHLSVSENSANGCSVFDTMNVVIEDTIALACNNSVQISLDANCAGELTADMFLEDPQYEDNSYQLFIQDDNGVFLNQDTLSSDMVGKTYTVTVQHQCSGNMCWSYMLVLDKTAPEVACSSDTVRCSDNIRPQDLNMYPIIHYTSIQTTANPYVYIAQGTPGCSDLTMQYFDEVEEGDCGTDFTSIIYRTWFVSDPSGNQSSCVDTIYTTPTGLADITYPVNWDGLQGNHDFIEACSNYKKDSNGNPHPDYTGAPSGPLCANIMINYTDHKRIYLCGEGGQSYKVLREWVVMDNCTGNSFDTIQIIAVMDTRSPYVTIPGLVNNTLTVETQNYDCGSDVILPLPHISDCSETTYTVGYQLADEDGNFPDPIIPYTTVQPQGGSYILHSIPTGLARVKYTVKDDCGNTTEKVFNVKVQDNLPPQAICDEHTTITLTDEGIGYLNKITFDDGSYDNCTDVTFRVRRMSSTCDPQDTQWGDGVHFCCDDVSQTEPVMVELEVTDANGFKNSCMAQVYVQDKERPQITCPSNGEVSCKFDYSDLSVFGTVRQSEELVQKIYVNDPEKGGNHIYFGKDGFASDNCNITIEELTPSVSINNCGTGYIYRRFRAQDDFGNKSQICTQTITVKDFDPFDPRYDLIWPADYVTDGCLEDATDPDNLPESYSWPRIIGDDKCSMIAYDFDDLVFEHIDGMCYKILRKWRVIDWCQYDQNDPLNSGGYWEHVQTLIINDDIDPVFVSGCAPVSIDALGNCQYRVSFNVEATDNCTASNNLVYSYKLNIDNSQTNVVTGTGTSFSYVLSKGTHKITWYAEDHCGNIGTCTNTFIVQDNKAPTPQCLEGLVTVLLEENGQVEINAADFNRHSTDDCTASNYGTCGCLTDLRFSFSTNVNDKTKLLNCNDIENGIMDTIELQMWVTDESGNQDFCNTFIVLQDNADVCPDVIPPIDTMFYNIAGTINTPDEKPIGGVELKLYSQNNEIHSSEESNEQGQFEFTSVPDVYNYDLVAEKSGDDLNGITTLDIVYIQKHLLGIKSLSNPYKLIAADINNSGNISAADILELRKLILGKNDHFQSNNSWKFVPKDYEFDNPNIPYNFNPKLKLGQLQDNINTGFTGIKVGDLNNSANVNSMGALENRNTNEFSFVIDNHKFNSGKFVEIPFYLSENTELLGTQFTVKFNANDLIFNKIKEGKLIIKSNNISTDKLDKGYFTLSWNVAEFESISKDEVLFTLVFKAKNRGTIENNISINSDITGAEIYTRDQGMIKENKLKLNFRNSSSDNTFNVVQNVPNPFSDYTTIGLVIPKEMEVNLTIYDITGKKLYEVSKNMPKGENELKVSKKDLRSTGVLYYKIQAGPYSDMKKMILIK